MPKEKQQEEAVASAVAAEAQAPAASADGGHADGAGGGRRRRRLRIPRLGRRRRRTQSPQRDEGRALARARLSTCVSAFLVALVVLLAAFAACHVYPFGDTSVMLYDMQWQYDGYFGWLCNVLHGETSGQLYSNAKGLGGGMYTLFAYYLSSPFNLLAAFFTADDVPRMFSWLLLAKIPTCALTCAVFLTGRFADHVEAPDDRLVVVMASVGYALCGCIGSYCTNVMWIDGYYMLPLVALGVWRLVQRRQVGLLYGTVVLAVLFNWYTAYMDCLFAVLYFVFEAMRANAWSLRVNKAALLRLFGRFVAVMALAVATSMVFLWPNVVEQMQGKGDSAGIAAVLSQPVFSKQALVVWGQFCLGSAAADTMGPAPVYTSALVVLLALSFLCARGFRTSDRKGYAAMLLVLLFSLVSPMAAAVWSGLFPSTSYTYRHTYVVSFFLVVMAVEGWSVLRRCDAANARRSVGAAAVVQLVVVGAGCVATRLLQPASAVSWTWMAAYVGVVAASAAFLLGTSHLHRQALSVERAQLLGRPGSAPERRSLTRRFALVMAAGLLGFMAVECAQSWAYFHKQNQPASAYQAYISQMRDVYGSLDDDGFLRVEQTGMSHTWYPATGHTDSGKGSPRDDSLAVNVSSLTHYSSTQNNDEQDLMAHLGYTKRTLFGTYSCSPLLATDMLLGVDYVVDDRPVPGATRVDAQLPSPQFSLYRYDETLPLAYGVADVADMGWCGQPTGADDDPFANQETLFSALTGQDASGLYTKDAVSEQGSDQSQRTFRVTVEQSGAAYAILGSDLRDLTTDGGIVCRVDVNGQVLQNTGGRFSCGIVYLGDFNAGDVVTVTVTPTPEFQSVPCAGGRSVYAEEGFWNLSADDLMHVESLDRQTLDGLLGSFDADGVDVEDVEDGEVSLGFDARDDEVLMVTLPWDVGWTATVDGQDVPVEKAADAFCGVQVHEGHNEVRLHYRTPGVMAGLAMSAAGAVAFAAWQATAALRRRRARAQKADRSQGQG